MAALQALTELRHQLDLVERHHVARALEAGHTFTAIAVPLAISRQAAHRRYRDLAAPPAPRRAATLSPAPVPRSHGPARRPPATGAQSIESEHLLVAVARTGVLSLDIEAARRTFGPPAVRAPEPTGWTVTAHPAHPVERHAPLDHLARAALEDPGGGARRVLERLGHTAADGPRPALNVALMECVSSCTFVRV